MNAAIEHLRIQEESLLPEDVVRLSLFGHKHINYLAHCSFNLPETIQKGNLRPFHAPENLSGMEEQPFDG